MTKQNRILLFVADNLLLVGVGLAIGFWVFESAVHAFVFQEGPFLEQLSGHDVNEAWMRLVVGGVIIGYSFYAQGVLSKLTRSEREKALVIEELTDALGRIETLRGLIPICSYCKRIRDDKGYWNKIESYISEHSRAEFTHGICPECEEKLKNEVIA